MNRLVLASTAGLDVLATLASVACRPSASYELSETWSLLWVALPSSMVLAATIAKRMTTFLDDDVAE
ncbi:MAG: hypothetical protein DWQ37_11315 [Planctomycetota bacterium]|nr:MAG: hypothetical protein DWQ37_11315 [Planctomycetota bacterium]